MKTFFFNAVKSGNVIGDGTVGDLLNWIKRFVNATFPDNGIEYWSGDRSSGPNHLKHYRVAPVGTNYMTKLHHFASYVHRGSCEGYIIEIAGYLYDGTTVRIGFAKSGGGADPPMSR